MTMTLPTRGGAGAARLREAEGRLWASLGVGPVERRVRLPGLGIDVRVQVLGSGPPILFLHGGSTCGTSWADLAVRLPHHRCLLLDRPGTGLSEALRIPVRDLAGLEGLADTLVAEVLDGLGLESADVVATSFGGSFALRGALASPGRVRRLVMFGWTAGAPSGALPPALRLGTAPVLGDLLARLPASDGLARQILRRIGVGAALDDGRISREAVSAFAAVLSRTDTLRNDLALGRLFISPGRGVGRGSVLSAAARSRVTQPILFAWGTADPFGGEAVARAFVAPFPDARLVLLPGIGHAPWMDDPAGAAALTAEFLAPGSGARPPGGQPPSRA